MFGNVKYICFFCLKAIGPWTATEFLLALNTVFLGGGIIVFTVLFWPWLPTFRPPRLSLVGVYIMCTHHPYIFSILALPGRIKVSIFSLQLVIFWSRVIWLFCFTFQTSSVDTFWIPFCWFFPFSFNIYQNMTLA